MLHANHHPAPWPGVGYSNHLEGKQQIHLDVHKGNMLVGLSQPPGLTPRDDPGSPAVRSLRSPVPTWQAAALGAQAIPRLLEGREGLSSIVNVFPF